MVYILLMPWISIPFLSYSVFLSLTRSNMLRPLLLFILLFASVISQASAPLLLDNSTPRMPLWGHMAVWEDPSASADLTTVSRLPDSAFRPLSRPFSGGYSHSAFWLKFELRRHTGTSRHWLLEVQPMYLDDLQLYHLAPDLPLGLQRSGDRLPFASRPHPYRGFVFDIPLYDEQTHTFYLRLHTNSTSLAVPVLMTPDAFLAEQQGDTLREGIFFGILAIMLLHTLVYWSWFRERFYLAFISQLSMLLLMGLGYGGFASQYLFPEQPALADLLTPLGNCLYSLSTQLFFILFLDIRRSHPRLYRLWQCNIGIALLVLGSIFSGHYLLMAPLLGLTSLLAIPLGIYQSWHVWQRGQTGGRTVFFGCLIYGIVAAGNLLAVLGILPAERALVHGWQYSAAIFMLFLQHAVLSRLRQYQHEQHKAEERIALAERGHRDEQARRQRQSQFLSLMSHELKTPLAVIDSAVQVLEYTRQQEDEHSAIRHERIRRAVAQLNNLLENALARERNDDHELLARPEAMSLQTLVDDVLATLQDPQQQLRTASLPDTTLHGDPSLLRIALGNLLGNALKYATPGSPISLAGQLAPAPVGQPSLQLTIRNHSSPLPADFAERAFERYWRGPNSQGQHGIGLGLYLIATIAQAHGGHCHCRLEEQYVSFTLELPIAPHHA